MKYIDIKDWIVSHRWGVTGCAVSFACGLLCYMMLHHCAEPEPLSSERVRVDTLFADGSHYEGWMRRGEKDGDGTLVTPDSVVWEGRWLQDRFCEGVKTAKTYTYRGHFNEEGQFDGFGVIEYSQAFCDNMCRDGKEAKDVVRRYAGMWVKDMKEGQGKAVMHDGTFCYGRFAEGVFKPNKALKFKYGERVFGIDVSHHQGEINWDKLAIYCDKDGVTYYSEPRSRTLTQPVMFAYVKATQGNTFKDARYEEYMREAKNHDIARGSYHFYTLKSSPESQAEHFLNTAMLWQRGDMPPMLDVEFNDSERGDIPPTYSEDILTWLEMVEESMGCRPIIYTRENIKNVYMKDSRFAKYDFWIARYQKRPVDENWLIWQRSGSGFVRGCDADVDIDEFKGDYEAFVRYLERI